MAFVQIIEYETDRAADIEATMQDGMNQQQNPPGFARMAYTQDRDNPNRYFMIVEFDSYEAAMANSNAPETDAMAKQLAALCTSGPKFYNLDVKMAMP
jgi:quinol monooxygenase YgiN